ncbi:hypothetical protein Trydic_g17701 [Trypoxylus dichotomus]
MADVDIHPSKECEDHWTINLMNHILKIFLKIIHRRIFRNAEQYLGRTQFGFRNAMGTREVTFALNMLTQSCRDINQSIYVCVLDFSFQQGMAQSPYINVKRRKEARIYNKGEFSEEVKIK